MHDIISQNKVVLSKTYTAGEVYLIEMNDSMAAVIGFKNGENEPSCSRAFFYNDNKKKLVMKEAKKYYNKIKSYLILNKANLLETLD